MRVSCSFVSTVILVAGQFQCAPILGLDGGLLSTNDKLLDSLTHAANVIPTTGKLTNGLLGGSKDGATAGLTTNGLLVEPKVADVLEDSKPNSLLEGSKSGGLLTLSGYNGGDSVLTTHGLLGESSLKKRLNLPLIGELGSFDGLKAKAESMASGLGSKISGLLRRRHTQTSMPALTSALANVPGVGYFPGMPNIPPVSTLPGINHLPGLSLVPGLGTTTAASGLGAAATRIASTHERATIATVTQGPEQGINTAFTGLFGGLSQAPVALDHIL